MQLEKSVYYQVTFLSILIFFKKKFFLKAYNFQALCESVKGINGSPSPAPPFFLVFVLVT